MKSTTWLCAAPAGAQFVFRVERETNRKIGHRRTRKVSGGVGQSWRTAECVGFPFGFLLSQCQKGLSFYLHALWTGDLRAKSVCSGH